MLTMLKAAVRSRATGAVRSASFSLLKPMLIFCTMIFNAVIVERPEQMPC